jgi:Ferritin-like domain
MNRRSFITGSLAAAPAVAAFTPTPVWAQAADYGTDADVLNYALVAEYFLSEFYRRAQVQLSGKEARYIESIGADEDAHIAAITQTIQNLGSTPVQAPAIDYGGALASRESLLKFALRFENLFARAYLGAAPAIRNKEILQAAAGIFGVEERHAAVVAQLLNRRADGGVFVGATDTPAGKGEVLRALKPYLTGAKSETGGAAVTL